MSIYSTVDYLFYDGVKDGKQRGIQEGTCRQISKLLLRYGKRAFGTPSDDQRDLLRALADHLDQATLETLQDQIFSVTGWAELLTGISALQQPLPAACEYLLPYDFNPTPMPPSIDTHARVKTHAGETMIIHMRFQRLYQEDLGAVLYRESKQLEEQHRCPVQTVVLMLWDGADGPKMTGEYQPPTGDVYRYHLTRLWEKDVEEMFVGVATAMFAPLSRFDPARLPEIVKRMDEVISAQTDPEAVRNFWSVAYTSMGLRYPAARVNELLAHRLPFLYTCSDVRTTLSEGYYAGQSEGQLEGAVLVTRRWILSVGGKRLPEPPLDFRQTLDSIQDLPRLEQIASRASKAATWQDMLTLS